MISGTLSGGGGGGGGRALDFREKKKKMDKEGEFLLDGCPIPGNDPLNPRTRWLARIFAFFLYLITLAIVGAMTVLVIMAKPIIQHNGYIETICRVNETRLFGEQSCRCGMGCKSLLPCGQVFVNYPLDMNETENQQWVYRKLLHEDQLNEKHYPICSISSSAHCWIEKAYNGKDVNIFIDAYNDTKHLGQSFPCYYAPHNLDSVLLTIVPSTWFIQIILAGSWGLVGALLVLLVLLGFCLIACNNCARRAEPGPLMVQDEIPMATKDGLDDSGWVDPVAPDGPASGPGAKDLDALPEAVRVDFKGQERML